MKALSIIQPWAWLIAAGHKDIENRTWRAPDSMIGQRIVIHASKKRDELEELEASALCRRVGIGRLDVELAYGSAIGTARIAGLTNSHFSPWFFGPWGIVLADAELWKTPVPYKGALGFWEFPADRIPDGVRTA